MELGKSKYRIRCEMGDCKNFSEYTLRTARVGLRAHLHICEACLNGLYTLIGKEIVPKPVENAIGGRRSNIRKKT